MRKLNLLTVACATIAVSTLSFLRPNAAEAIDRYGHANVSVGLPVSDASFNSFAQPVSIVKGPPGSGKIEVTFRGLAPRGTGGHVQVSTNKSNLAYCNVDRWFRSGEDATVQLACFGPDGNPPGLLSLSMLYVGDVLGEGRGLAFALADQPSASRYIPDRTFQFNGGRGPLSITRAGAGRYRVLVPGMAREIRPTPSFGNVQVSTVGSTPVRCILENWVEAEPGGADLAVEVRCRDPRGALSDAPFSVMVLHPSGLTKMQRAYTRSRNSGATPLALPGEYAFNSVTGRNSGIGTGSGDVRIFGPFGLGTARPTIALTTAVGGSGWCQTGHLSSRTNTALDTLGSEYLYDPLCLNQSGTRSEGGYSVLLLTGEQMPLNPISGRKMRLDFKRVTAFAGDGNCGDEVELFMRATTRGITTATIDTERREVDARPGVSQSVSWRVPWIDVSAFEARGEMELWENDDFTCGRDDRFDISPGDGTLLPLTFDFRRRLVIDENGRRILGNIGDEITTRGRGPNPAQVTFMIRFVPPL